MVKIKICGIKKLEDAKFAANCGADFLGFVFFKESPRFIKPKEAQKIISRLPKSVKTIGVFVNQPQEEIKKTAYFCKFSYVQLHGNETPNFIKSLKIPVIKAFRIKKESDLKFLSKFEVFAYLFDSYNKFIFGGTGKTFDIDLIKNKQIKKPFFISGGLNPNNVTTVISKVKPYAVDVSSGVEKSPGVKDHKKISQFIKAVKNFSYKKNLN